MNLEKLALSDFSRFFFYIFELFSNFPYIIYILKLQNCSATKVVLEAAMFHCRGCSGLCVSQRDETLRGSLELRFLSGFLEGGKYGTFYRFTKDKA